MKQFSRLAAMGMLAICALPAAARPQSIGQLATYNALAADDSAPRALRVNDQPIDRELLVQPHVGDFSARITLSPRQGASAFDSATGARRLRRSSPRPNLAKP